MRLCRPPARTRYTAEHIVGKLREAEVWLSKGITAAQLCRQFGVGEQTFCCWRRANGGMKVAQAKRSQELEKENTRLRRAVANSSLDKLILVEAAKGSLGALRVAGAV